MDLRQSRNLLVQRLSPEDRERIAGSFEAQRLEHKQTLLEQDKPVKYVYFMETAVASMVMDLSDGLTVEAGIIGYEGFVGLPAVLDAPHSLSRVFCQVPGSTLRVPADTIEHERERATPWFRVLLRYVHFVSAMASQIAACNRLHAVDSRLSRWLLMTHDRVDGDTLQLTQEFLGIMLGAARPTVNIAGAMLQKAGMIRYSRGRITVLDREALESASCECYARLRDALQETLEWSGRR